MFVVDLATEGEEARIGEGLAPLRCSELDVVDSIPGFIVGIVQSLIVSRERGREGGKTRQKRGSGTVPPQYPFSARHIQKSQSSPPSLKFSTSYRQPESSTAAEL